MSYDEDSSSSSASMGFGSKWDEFIKKELPDDLEVRKPSGFISGKDRYERLYECRKSIPWYNINTANCENAVEVEKNKQKKEDNNNIPKITEYEPTVKETGKLSAIRMYNEYMDALKVKKEREKEEIEKQAQKKNKSSLATKLYTNPWKLFKTAYDSFMENAINAFERYKYTSKIDSPSNNSLPMVAEDIVNEEDLEQVINMLFYVLKENKEAKMAFSELRDILVWLTEEEDRYKRGMCGLTESSDALENSEKTDQDPENKYINQGLKDRCKNIDNKQTSKHKPRRAISKTVFLRFMKTLFQRRYKNKGEYFSQMKEENRIKLINYMNEIFGDITSEYERARDLFIIATDPVNSRLLGEYRATKEFMNRYKEKAPTLSKKEADNLVNKLIKTADEAREKRENAERDKMYQEIAECTFNPSFRSSYPNTQSNGPKISRRKFFDDLQKPIRKPSTMLTTEEKELLECTFQPKITSNRIKPVLSFSSSEIIHDMESVNKRQASYKASALSGNRYNINWDADSEDDKSAIISIASDNQDTWTSSNDSRMYDARKDPKGYKETINRLRLAKLRREQAERDLENIGRVDKSLLKKIKRIKDDSSLNSGNDTDANIYSSLSQQKPFNLQTETRAKSKRLMDVPVLLHIDVRIGSGKTGRISVKKGDTAQKLAKEFSKIYALNDQVRDTLESVIQKRMNENGIC